jgi:hypothetical protein
MHQSSPTGYQSDWVPVRLGTGPTWYPVRLDASPTGYPVRLGTRSDWVPSPTGCRSDWVPSPTGCRSDWGTQSDWIKLWAIALTTTDTCSMNINQHSCQTQSDWVSIDWGTQSDWVWHEWWSMFIEQVSVVVRAIAQSFIQSDWVPQSDRHPVGLGTPVGPAPSRTGYPVWLVPNRTGLVHP